VASAGFVIYEVSVKGLVLGQRYRTPHKPQQIQNSHGAQKELQRRSSIAVLCVLADRVTVLACFGVQLLI